MRQTNHNGHASIQDKIKEIGRWLIPGIGVKRWLVLILIGITFLGLGFAVLVLDVYRTAPQTWWLPIISALSLRFLGRTLRAIIFGGSGVIMVLVGIWGLNRALLRPFLKPGQPLLDTVSAYRKKEKGPRIVAIGGGNGLSSLLRGLKAHTNKLTAIVTVADDGGSSGELRRNFGVLPPGDIRNCLAALSDDEQLLTQIFQYRFASGMGLNGHTLGNLFITALADVTGSFEEGVAESARVLAVRGQVLPSTLHDVRLVADIEVDPQENSIQIKGESEIPKARGRIRRVWLEPGNPAAYPEAVKAVLSADMVIIGPGSLFTSIIPNLLVPDLAKAIKASRALKVFICNVATQYGETEGFSSGDHVRTVLKYLDDMRFDLVICNKQFSGKLGEGVTWVKSEEDLDQEFPVYFANLADAGNPWRHNSQLLAETILNLFYERTGPLSSKEDSI